MQQNNEKFPGFASRLAKALDINQNRAKGSKHVYFTYFIGEEVEVKQGKFRIKNLGKRFMVLEGLPGTRIKEVKK